MTEPTYLFDLSAKTVDEALAQVYEHLKASGSLHKDALEELQLQLQRHGDLGPDQLEQGVSVIHHHTQSIESLEVLVRLSNDIEPIYGEDHVPLRFIWILFSTAKTHESMARVSEFLNLVKEPSVREAFSGVQNAEEFNRVYATSLSQVMHNEHHIPDELKPTPKGMKAH